MAKMARRKRVAAYLRQPGRRGYRNGFPGRAASVVHERIRRAVRTARDKKIYGFPLGGKCFINRDCKVAPIRKYLAEIAGGPLRAKTNIVQYIGIAADEPRRLAKLTENRMSLLAKYGYTEQMAKQLCATHGLLSPIYTTGTRGGCWFCPNCKIQHFVNLRRNHPELWAELVELSHTPNLCSYGFKYGLTVQEVEKRMNAEEQQLKLF